MSILVSLGTYDGRVLGYDVKTQSWTFAFPAHLGCVNAMASCSTSTNNSGPNSTMVSAASDDSCKVFHLGHKKMIGSLEGHEGGVNSVCVLKKHIVTGGEDGKLCVWRAHDLELLSTLAKSQPVTAMAVDPAEKILLTAHRDMRIRMWGLENGKPVGGLVFRDLF